MQRLVWKRIVPHNEAFHIARIQFRGRNTCRVHTHGDFAEVFWAESGEGIHLINGTNQPLRRGTLVMMRARDCHGFRADPQNGVTLVNVAFPVESLAFLRTRYFQNETRFFWATTNLPHQITLRASELRWLTDSAAKLARAPKTRLEIERFLLDLLHEVPGQPVNSEAQPLPDWMASALLGIRDPQHFVRGTPGLARLAGRSPEHVNRELRRHIRLTATDVVNQARMEHAAHQLRMTTKKIVEISLECGFQNLGHFYQIFRKQFGVTPRTHRLRHHAVAR